MLKVDINEMLDGDTRSYGDSMKRCDAMAPPNKGLL